MPRPAPHCSFPPPGTGRTAREHILPFFERAKEQAGLPGSYGCPFLAVQVEPKDAEHPAARVARRIKGGLTEFFRAEAERGGATDPALPARRLIPVFDGASARAGTRADDLTELILPTVNRAAEPRGCAVSREACCTRCVTVG